MKEIQKHFPHPQESLSTTTTTTQRLTWNVERENYDLNTGMAETPGNESEQVQSGRQGTPIGTDHANEGEVRSATMATMTTNLETTGEEGGTERAGGSHKATGKRNRRMKEMIQSNGELGTWRHQLRKRATIEKGEIHVRMTRMCAKKSTAKEMNDRPLLVDIEGAASDILIGYSRVPLERLCSPQIRFGGEYESLM